MSVLTEYLKLIPKALGNPEELLKSWVNVARMELGSLPEEEVEEVVKRRIICGTCPFMSENAKGYVSSRTDSHCILCGCPIIAKTAGLDNYCGAKSYNESHPDKPQLIKWHPYAKTI